MTETPQKPKRPRGRPAGQPPKIRLKPSPKTAKEDYYKKYGEIGVCAIYGVDEFTDALIDYLWNHPEMEILVTDPNEDKVTHLNRKYGARSFSAYRWHVFDHRGFIEEALVEVMVVSKDLIEEVRKLPNPNDVEFIVLEEL
jgi:hypothetical protein